MESGLLSEVLMETLIKLIPVFVYLPIMAIIFLWCIYEEKEADRRWKRRIDRSWTDYDMDKRA